MGRAKSRPCIFSAKRVQGSDRGGDRTHDLRIKSPLLYQLSYPVPALQYIAFRHFTTRPIWTGPWSIGCRPPTRRSDDQA